MNSVIFDGSCMNLIHLSLTMGYNRNNFFKQFVLYPRLGRPKVVEYLRSGTGHPRVSLRTRPGDGTESGYAQQFAPVRIFVNVTLCGPEYAPSPKEVFPAILVMKVQ
jgi:hypothetical protein